MPIECKLHDLNGVPTKYFYARVNPDYRTQKVVQKVGDFDTPLRSDVEYFIDGIIDLAGTTLYVGSGGAYFHGYNFDLSQLIDTTDNATMFLSAIGGSGNILMHDMAVTASGASSKVWDLVGATGFEAIELFQVNYNDCVNLGTITNYRQGLETGTGRFGGSPCLELDGTWLGGFRVTTSIVRSLDAGMTTPLFKKGATFTMASRFLTDINCDLPASASFADFIASNFIKPSSFQLHDAIISRDGVLNADDSNITPNLLYSDLASSFRDSQGIPNTHIGGRTSVTAEVQTVVSVVGTFYPLLATWATSDLQHFDSPAAGQLRHLGSDPRGYKVIADLVVDGAQNAEVEVRVVRYKSATASLVYIGSQRRTVNNLAGGRDVAFFAMNINIHLDVNDYVYLEIANNTGTQNVTVETDSFYDVEERA